MPSPPFTFEEDLSRLANLLPSSLIFEEMSRYLHRVHKKGIANIERSHWIGVCEGYINALKIAQLVSEAQVPDLREIVQWAVQRSSGK